MGQVDIISGIGLAVRRAFRVSGMAGVLALGLVQGSKPFSATTSHGVSGIMGVTIFITRLENKKGIHISL